jgi:hypothetical protein
LRILSHFVQTELDHLLGVNGGGLKGMLLAMLVAGALMDGGFCNLPPPLLE